MMLPSLCKQISLEGTPRPDDYRKLVSCVKNDKLDFYPEAIRKDIIGEWGPMRLTDWIVIRSQTDDPQGWLDKLPGIVDFLQKRVSGLDGWRADVFAAVLGIFVASQDKDYDFHPMARTLAKLYTSVVADATAHLYWPSEWRAAETATAHEFLCIREGFRKVLQSAAERTVLGALAGKLGRKGVVHIGLRLAASGQEAWTLRVLPWSRHIPKPGALQEQRDAVARTAKGHLGNVPPHEVFLSLQPNQSQSHEAVASVRDFDGESLGLAIVLALFANVCQRELNAWATGKLSSDGKVGEVDYVKEKSEALGHYLLRPPTGSSAIKLEHLCIFVPVAANGKKDAESGLKDVGAKEYIGRITPVDEIKHLLDPARLTDPFHRDLQELPGLSDFFKLFRVPTDTLKTEKYDPADAPFWSSLTPSNVGDSTGTKTIGEEIAAKWKTGEPDPKAREILICTPFQADRALATELVRASALRLAAFLSYRRAQVQEDNTHTRFPVPFLLNLADWDPDEKLGEHFLRPSIGGPDSYSAKPTEVFSGLSAESINTALDQHHRLAIVLYDTDVPDSRLFEQSKRSFRRFGEAVRILLGKEPSSGVKPQCLIAIAPDIHVQMFWQQRLGEEGCEFDDAPVTVQF